ncbi:MAG: hypothetical protein ACK5IN_02860, partial [Microbacterium sp.]
MRSHHGLIVASPASTWVQLAASLSLRDLVAAGDALITVPRDERGRKLPAEAAIATGGELGAAVATLRRRGARRLRRALELVRVGSSTSAKATGESSGTASWCTPSTGPWSSTRATMRPCPR